MTAPTVQTTKMDSITATKWCKEQNGQIELSMVIDIPDGEWSEEQIRQAVTVLAPDRKVFVIDTKKDQETSHTYALVEWKKGIPDCFRGDSIQLTAETRAMLCSLSASDHNTEKPDQSTSGVSEDATSSASVVNCLPASFFTDIKVLAESSLKNLSQSSQYGYRKLRLYSGKLPVPSGEEDFEVWIDQASQALDEWNVPEVQKKQRILESLKGPAAEIIRSLKLSKRDCTAADYLEALRAVYGGVEKLSDLMYKFEHTYQRKGEKLSDYVIRVDKALYPIIQKKGIDSQTVDKTRLNQILQGARPNHPIVLKILFKGPNHVPIYPELIREIREEEALIEEKNKTPESSEKVNPKRGRVSMYPTQIRDYPSDEGDSEASDSEEWDFNQPPSDPVTQDVILQLVNAQRELYQMVMKIQETQGDFNKVLAKMMETQTTQQRSESPFESMTPTTTPEEEISNRNQDKPSLLRGGCCRCEREYLTRPTVKFSGAPRREKSFKPAGKLQRTPVKEPSGRPTIQANSNFKTRKQKSPRPKPVIRASPTVGERPPILVSDPSPRESNAHLSAQRSKRRKLESLTRGKRRARVRNTNTTPLMESSSRYPVELVGPSPVVPVQVEGVFTKALLDSGAQVTLIYQDFYDKYLKHIPLKKLEGLEIWGIGTKQLPYTGYLQVKLDFSPTIVGQAGTFDTLAIVGPRPPGSNRNSIIVGTNTALVRRLLAPLVTSQNPTSEKIHPALQAVFMRMIQEQKGPAEVGRLWKLGGAERVLQPGETASLKAVVRLNWNQPGPYVVLETYPEDLEDTGIEVMPKLVSTKMLHRFQGRTSVNVCNVSDFPVTLKPRMPLGQVVSATPLSPTDSQKELGKEIPAEKFYPESAPISSEWKQRIQSQLLKWQELFSKDEFDVGQAKSTQHRIRLQDDKPFRERSRRVPLGDLDDLREQLSELKRTGIIQESRSPYASPIVVVRKKNGSIRLCIDYRTLNKRTIPDQYTTPRIEDALQCLSGAKWFSVLDLRSGYHQIPMHPEDKEKTAFICPLGFFEFNRMPQGLTGAPATFQRLMEKTVGDMNLIEVLVYLDDLIVFGRTLEEHEQRLEKVLSRLHEEGLKLSLEKCQFCLPSVNYLGHVVSDEGVSTDPQKIEAVTSWPRPRTVTELRSFLGFCSYYRRFVKGFAKIAHPLNALLKTDGENEESTPQGLKPTNRGPRKSKESIESEWTEECERAFRRLKGRLTAAPVLAYADPSKPYELHVDACREGLGGVLYQQFDGHLRPVAYVSRSLNASERNYPTHKLEFLALKWAVVDKLRDYLYGADFVVKTDNNPLTYLLTTAKLDATGHRWLAALSGFRFSLTYRPGAGNQDADALSRRPHGVEAKGEQWIHVTPEGVRALCQGTELREKGASSIEAIGVMAASVPKLYCSPSQLRDTGLPTFSKKDLREEQDQDPLIRLTKKALREKKRELLLTSSPPEARLIHREWNNLLTKEGVIYRRGPPNDLEERLQLFLPEKYRSDVLRALHDDHGHLGSDRTFKLVRDRFYWPHMRNEVEKYCHSCLRCIQRKTLPSRAAPMGHLQSQGPMDLVCIDFLCLESDTSGQGNVLVVTDHFTRYAQAYPTKDQRAITVAKVLVEKFFIHYGLPQQIHSDQGRDFESRLIKQLLDLLGVQKTRTTPYHPQGDAQPERFNRTLLDMLGTLSTEEKQHWSRHIAAIVHAYNSTENDTTGYSPYRLMFGREARLPIDLAFGLSVDRTSATAHKGYVDRLRRNLAFAYDKAQHMAESREQRNQRNYDLRVRVQNLQPGDRVLLRNLGPAAKHKLADRWSSQVYIVCRQLSGLPVYQIRPEGKEGPLKNWHRNHLLPLSEAVRVPISQEPPRVSSKSTPVTRSQRLPVVTEEEEDSEDEEMGLSWIWPSDPVETSQNSMPLESNSSNLRASAPEFIPQLYQEEPPISQDIPQLNQEEPSISQDTFEGESCVLYETPDPVPSSPCSEEASNQVEEGVVETPQTLSCPVEDDPDEGPSWLLESRYKRPVRPPKRLTYDVPGHSTEEAITTVQRSPEGSTLLIETRPESHPMQTTHTPWWKLPIPASLISRYKAKRVKASN